ncbi:hypothetical protein Tco_0485658 [Tanacetum coccineum]
MPVLPIRTSRPPCPPTHPSSAFDLLRDALSAIFGLSELKGGVFQTRPLDEIQVYAKLNFIEEHVEILGRLFKKLKRSRIAIVKVRWNSKRGPEFTWERKDQMKLKSCRGAVVDFSLCIEFSEESVALRTRYVLMTGIKVIDPNSSLGKICLGENVVVISSDKVKGSGDWNSPEFQDTANSRQKKETKAMVFYQMDTEEVSDRFVALCFVNELET